MPEWQFAEDRNCSSSLTALACAFCALSVPAHAIELGLEVGPSAVVTNLLQRPMTADGTRFNATAYTGRDITPWRVEAGWDDSWWGRGGRWQATYVPLRNDGEGVPGSDLLFGSARFVAGQPLALRYQFDTWRLAYTEHVGASWSGAWDWQVGGALAVRKRANPAPAGRYVAQFQQRRAGTARANRGFAAGGQRPAHHRIVRRLPSAGWRRVV